MDELYGKKYVFKGQTLSSLLSPEHAGNPIKDDAKARILRFIITGVGEFDGRLLFKNFFNVMATGDIYGESNEDIPVVVDVHSHIRLKECILAIAEKHWNSSII